MEVKNYKLEIFIPESHLRVLQEALQSVDAGHIGDYNGCMSYWPSMGCWRSLEGSNPYLGTVGEMSEEPEVIVFVQVKAENVRKTVELIKEVHPYEEAVVNIVPMYELEDFE